MKFTKIISGLLALGVLILFIKSYQNFKNLEFPSTQLVMFKSLSFYMSVESFENTFVAADKVVEEEEMAYRDTWRAEDPYFYKTGRLFYYYENMRWEGKAILSAQILHFQNGIPWKKRGLLFLLLQKWNRKNYLANYRRL